LKTWKTLQYLSAAAILLITTGCDLDKTSRLEKQVEELKAEVSKRHTTEEYNLQAKCSQDARTWFNQNYSGISRDKDTILLDYSNHYNKSANQYFALVEFHFNVGLKGEVNWMNDMSLWNVYENDKDGHFSQSHVFPSTPNRKSYEPILTCEVGGVKCDAIEKFNGMVQPYLAN